MKISKFTLGAAILALTFSGAAHADFGVGVKAGTLGLGVEGRWEPIPWIDFRAGINQYDYEDSGSHAGIGYDGTLALDNYFVTGNLKFPVSPMRLTVGAFANSNELQLLSQDTGGNNIEIGGSTFTPADIGTLTSTTSFGDTAPYLGIGFDFELFGKAGLNLDLGVLWQGEPSVAITADGLAASQPAFQSALEAERLELENSMSDYKAWPVISLGFVYNF
ncbi:MAG: hypothetical protein AAFN50_06255 [Pseudomonadota bacterium]